MTDIGFYHPSRGYWQAIAGAAEELLPTYPVGTVEVPLKPGPNYEWDGSGWQERDAAPEIFQPLTPRQFWLAALTAGITEADVDAEIDAMDEPDRSEARINKNYAVIYERDSILIAQLASSFGLTSDGVDSLWRLAETL